MQAVGALTLARPCQVGAPCLLYLALLRPLRGRLKRSSVLDRPFNFDDPTERDEELISGCALCGYV